jgi:hypothetical protein
MKNKERTTQNAMMYKNIKNGTASFTEIANGS